MSAALDDRHDAVAAGGRPAGPAGARASSSTTAGSWRSTMPISSCKPNEILGVIGDNGAGKSTLIKVLAGAVIPDAGEVLMDGKPVHFRSPIEARNAGIETVYQNLALSPALSIADNLFLGREKRKPGPLGQHLPPARSRRDAARGAPST